MPALDVLSNAVAWLPWGGAAFARAHAEHKPVLLSIAAAWCRWCHEMDRTSYADPSIVAIINTRFVPIRVDADERPDISERYNLGGWPTTAFLTPSGEILAGGTFVAPDRMAAALAQVADAFAARGIGLSDDSGAETSPPGPEASLTVDELCHGVFSTFDEEHGGFGTEPKFPLTAPLHLALDLFAETRDPRYEMVGVATLDAMGWGGLYDEVDGGFFRYAAARDWQLPHVEKMLEVNAALLRLYLDAGAVLEAARFTERGADALRYVQNWLADPVDGGWGGSQAADDRYYAADSIEGRRTLSAPPVNRVLFTDWNAAMVSAALHAATVFDDDGLRQFAIKSLERILLTCYKPAMGVAHYFDGEARVRGLLADQMAMAAASLDAYDASGNIVYEMMAEELAHYAIRVLWDDRDGGFFDRAAEPPGAEPDIGLMRRPLKPFALNCDASRTLRRLALASGDQEFAHVADRILAAMAPLAGAQGPLAAHYVLAVRAARPR
jgi:uncharacterized protein YyaL (SSP411 family)